VVAGLGVAAASAMLVGLGLGAHPLLDPNEAKHALIAAETLAAGSWLEPVLNGGAYHDKPALFYVLVGLAYRFFGIGELGARAVPALATVATLLATHLVAARRGLAQGLVAWGLLASTLPFVQLGRFTSLDALFCFALSGAVFAGASRSDDPGPLTLPWSAFVLAALAVLVKGPVALVLLGPLVVVAARDGGLDWRRCAAGAGLTSALVAAWAVPTYLAHADYLGEFLWTHNLARYFTPEEKFHEQPVYFFLPVLFAALLPWSVLLPRVLRRAISAGRSDRLLLAFSVWVFVFFSFSAGKLATYIVPIVPALAVLTARWLLSNGSHGSGTDSAPRELPVGLAPLALLAPVGALGAAYEAPTLLPVAAALVPLSVGGIASLYAFRSGAATRRVLALACAGCLATTLLLDLVGGRAAATLTSDRDLAAFALARGRPERLVVYRVRPFSFLFYTRWHAIYKVSDDDYRTALKSPGSWLLLTKDKRLESLRAVVPGLRYAVAAENSRHLLLERDSEQLR
jgi:4-amino-4-deoxy-L-arabinose transferase-like glycosyltransferase